jgi:hypothetical protein
MELLRPSGEVPSLVAHVLELTQEKALKGGPSLAFHAWREGLGIAEDPAEVDVIRTGGKRLPVEIKLPLGGSTWGLPTKVRLQVRDLKSHATY